jgi:hypothetical protein
MNLRLLPAMSVLILSLSPVFAQDRYYVWTYQYGTEEATEFELESNSFFNTPSLSNNAHSLNQQFELEYGASDDLQLGLYQVFSRDYPSGSLSAKSSKLEVLYKLAPRNVLPADPMLYVEYSRDWNFKNPNKAEVKLILSRDIGKLDGTINGIAEYEFGGKTEFTPELSMGISYEIIQGVRLGVEGFSTMSDEKEANDEDLQGTALGPTVAISTPWFWLTTGASFGVSENSNALNFCTALGIDL